MTKQMVVALPLAALLAAGLVACDSNSSPLAPPDPDKELIDPERRVGTDNLGENETLVHVYGNFSIVFGGQRDILGGGEEAVFFPGKGKSGSGWCGVEGKPELNGLWINPQGRRTSGSPDKPHPHCVRGDEGVEIILEPITAIHVVVEEEALDEMLILGAPRGAGGGGAADEVYLHGTGRYGDTPNTKGRGTIEAWAIVASTINDAEPRRVGKLTINLAAEYEVAGLNVFADACVLDATIDYVRCLNHVIIADYEPYGDDPEGTAIISTTMEDGDERQITGMLYWAPAESAFNYTN
jgi:hypothetical protein